MEDNLTWFDKNLVPRTKAYKNFVKEIENTSTEHFFRDGERLFTDKEKKFMSIHQAKRKEVIIGSNFTLKTIYNANEGFPIEDKFNNPAELVRFIEKQELNYKVLILQNNRESTQTIIDSEAIKHKALSDLWAQELQVKTTLSSGLTSTQIDERQAFHYRIYEREAKILGIEVTPLKEIRILNKVSEQIEPKIYNSILSGDRRFSNQYSKQAQEKEIVGKITFYDSQEEINYYSSESYLNALRNEFDSNPDRFKYKTLLRTPELLKEVDDLVYDTHGEENPNSLELYRKKLGKETEIVREQIEDISDEAIRKPESLKQYDHIKQKTIKFFLNSKTPNIMETQKEFDQVQYLKDQLKYLGFGEDSTLHKDLEKGIKSKNQQFEIKTTSDKALPGNQVDFTLKFNKSESGGVFLNSYNAKLMNEKGEEISHNFPVSRENTFTAKEAVNLLEGRTVKIEFNNPKTEQLEPAFVKLNFDEPKTEKGNYQFQNFYKNYGVDTANILEKSNLIFDKPEYKENTIKSLEKGNIVKVKFELDDKVIEGRAVLNPQYKNLSLYDQDMNRINTNKPLEGIENDNKHDKNNVKEQSIKR